MKNIKYIDIHSHPNFPKLKEDLPEIISRMKEKEVGTIAIGVDKKTSEEVVELAKQNENIWACVGIHPDDSKDEFDENFFGELVKSPKVVCVGECGLDYFRLGESNPQINTDSQLGGSTSKLAEQVQINADEEKKRQKKLFIEQIDFAVSHDLPLMLHVRPSKGSQDAHLDVFKILESKKKEYGDKLRGNSHFFTSTWEIAEKYFELGFTISFTGLITYVWDFNKIIKNAPLDMIHAETDSPFVAPEPYRGERNEPSYVIEVVKKIAEIKDLPEVEVEKKLLQNATRLFGLES